MVSQKSDFKADAAGLCVTERGCGRAIRHGNNDVGIDRAFLGELLAHLAANLVAALLENLGVWAAEVDVFENAVGEAVFLREAFGMETVLGDGQKFAGLDVTNVVRAEQVECASFASDAPGFSHAGNRERPKTVTVAGDVHRVFA